ncbi:MAG: nitrile hydratase accessory protein [Bryobacteraceae bacterium]
MSALDPNVAEWLTDLPQLPRDEGGPVFAEPWQAQVFAIAVRLSAQGYFNWKEWAAALAAELADAAERDEADDGSEYYHHWLAALEKLVTAKGLTDVAALFERREAWADAYRHTPHGRPVQLRPGFRINYAYRQSPLHQVQRADGVVKEIRIQDGQLFICNGCCCGRTDKGFPELSLEEFKRQWKKRGIRRRLHLTISGCLGPCPLANVVLLQFRGRSMWFHSINHPGDVNLLYDYVERMLLAESILGPPEGLMSRCFDRYLTSSTLEDSTTE